MCDFWTVLNTNGSGISAIAAVAAAVIAIVAIVKTSGDTRARSQPAVIVELATARDSDTSIDLVVRNAGPTVAREVEVIFDPTLDLPDRSDITAPILQRRYSKPIPTLAPGQELRNIWWSGSAQPGSTELQNHEPLPDQVTVRVTYRGLGRRKLREEYPLDVDTITSTTYSVSSTSTKGRMKTINESLAKLAAAAQTIARGK